MKLLTGSSIQPDGSNSCLVYSHLPSYWGPAPYLRTQSKMTWHNKNFKQSIQPNIKCISVQDPDGLYRMHVHEASSVIPPHRGYQLTGQSCFLSYGQPGASLGLARALSFYFDKHENHIISCYKDWIQTVQNTLNISEKYYVTYFLIGTISSMKIISLATSQGRY